MAPSTDTKAAAPIGSADTPLTASLGDVPDFSGLFKAKQGSVGVKGGRDMKGS